MDDQEFIKACRKIAAPQAATFLNQHRTFLESNPNTACYMAAMDNRAMYPSDTLIKIITQVMILIMAKPTKAAKVSGATSARAYTSKAKPYHATIYLDGKALDTSAHDKGSSAFRWLDRALVDQPNSYGEVTFQGGAPIRVERDDAFKRVLGRAPGKPGAATKATTNGKGFAPYGKAEQTRVRFSKG